MKEKMILVVPLFLYDAEKAGLVAEAAKKIIEADEAFAVYTTCQYGLWKEIGETCINHKKHMVFWQLSKTATNEQQFLEDVIKFMHKFNNFYTAKIGLVSLEHCSERLRDMLDDAYIQNIDSLGCSFVVKALVVKYPFSFSKIKDSLIELWRNLWYQRGRNEG